MTNYARSAYGNTNPNAGYPANGNFDAWGGHCYPGGVPLTKLGYTGYTSVSSGQLLKVQLRAALVPLWNLVFEIQDRKHHYPVWSVRSNENWGPWGYENRAISGTSRPSGHSAALSVDENAPFNPYSYTFQCDMPPAMVADMESLGLYWGGRYANQRYDPMHFGYCRAPGDVSKYIQRAKDILAALNPPKPTPPRPAPEDDMTPDECRSVVREELVKFFTKDVVKVVGDEMSDPPNYDSTRDKIDMRDLRLTSIATATITGRDGRAPVPSK